MHELGIVFRIARDVLEVARANGAQRVSRVALGLGEVSGVVPELLEDAWAWHREREPGLEGCELEVRVRPAVTLCEDCGAEYATTEHGKTCPACGSSRTHLLRGQEVVIEEIEVPDA